ncbi:hypothetical protein ABH904_003681 [Pseudomonas frederiksbergensis]
MRTATIKRRSKPDWMTLVQPDNPSRATKPDHWESVTRTKLPTGLQTHKPADSDVVVGDGARRCSFQEVTLNKTKHALQNTPKPVGAGLPAMAACQSPQMSS